MARRIGDRNLSAPLADGLRHGIADFNFPLDESPPRPPPRAPRGWAREQACALVTPARLARGELAHLVDVGARLLVQRRRTPLLDELGRRTEALDVDERRQPLGEARSPLRGDRATEGVADDAHLTPWSRDHVDELGQVYEAMRPVARTLNMAETKDVLWGLFIERVRANMHIVLCMSPIGDNYTEVLSLAVDEAGGQAFVTEYVGPSSIVDRNGVWSDEWDAARFSAIEPTGVVVELENQGLAQCGEESCGWNHPLIASLLDEFLPVPAGVDQDAFYSCLSCYEDQIDPLAWNAMAFSTAFADRIEDPGLHAFEVLAIPTLTRIATTIDAIGPNQKEIQFPVDLDRWHRFLVQF